MGMWTLLMLGLIPTLKVRADSRTLALFESLCPNCAPLNRKTRSATVPNGRGFASKLVLDQQCCPNHLGHLGSSESPWPA